ncbi:MAG: hypothetical protein ACD_2C00040G0002 [uncultured bacterium (gcode 4)]|uniref:Peptidoglycan polymerization terminase n=1 Tax=uncultured bacterium (gcode 4) TaxID=1234023 RepID=K2FG54_9BACT|nr:MAG: hypothetical protein ACD_2C00040G0002 [uncultured bacterium (gcode 4)]
MKKLLLIILLIGALGYYSIINVWDTTVTKGKYTIEKNDTLTQLPQRLNIEVNPTLYKIWLKIRAPDIKLLAWTYEIKDDSTLSDVLSVGLKKPVALDREIMILPWWNIFDIDEMLAEKWIIKTWELISYSNEFPNSMRTRYPFLKNAVSLEWFIYPETYRIALDAKLEDVVWIALDTFESRVYKDFLNARLVWVDFYDTMIMASIVEREERNPKNKPIVAWILSKRLEQGIALWADATVCYAYEKTFKECTPEFISEKIYIKSKYNTRNKIWLPPTPISNLSEDTFKAAFTPEWSPYYYYLHDNSWWIHYWVTLQDHTRNVNLYLR